MRSLNARRVTLAPVDGRNARELWEVLNMPDLRKYQDIPRVRAEEFERQVRARPRQLRGGVTGRFEWLLKAGDRAEPIGWISLRVNDRSPRIGEVGYSLVMDARGKGYASEALGAVIDEAFEIGRARRDPGVHHPGEWRVALGARPNGLPRRTPVAKRRGDPRAARGRAAVHADARKLGPPAS